jgi:predicted nucleic acid-binding protein
VQGDRFVNKHPKDVMEAVGLVAQFKQLLGKDYPDIIEAISVASLTSCDAGYIISASMTGDPVLYT